MQYNQNKKIYLSTILLGIITGITLIALLYFFSWSLIVESYFENEGALGVVLAIVSRIGIVAVMTLYTFHQWFKQEEQYFSDIPFLFGMFFLFLIFGKSLDLFNNFVYFKLDENLVLLVFKARYIISVLDLFPMIYLSMDMLLFSLSLKKKFVKLTKEKYRAKIRKQILILILIVEFIAGLIVPNLTLLSILYPIIIIPSLVTVVWLFNFAWRNKRLSQVSTFILMIGFGLYLISSIIRPLTQIIVGESSLFVIIAESIDLVVFAIIFIGFYKRSNYPTNQ